jgi:hypothetical protein
VDKERAPAGGALETEAAANGPTGDNLMHASSEQFSTDGAEVQGVDLDLATILDQMTAEIEKHVILGPHYAEAVALWVLHAHGIKACQYSPRLNLRSPEAECGKTTLLEIIQAFCQVRGSQIESSTTPAAYFRFVHQASADAGGLPPSSIYRG